MGDLFVKSVQSDKFYFIHKGDILTVSDMLGF